MLRNFLIEPPTEGTTPLRTDAASFNISPSQLDLHGVCEAADYGRYVLGQVEPDKPWQADGKRWHREAELWMLEGVTPQSAQVQALLPHLPSPRVPRDRVEVHLRKLRPGKGITGKIDLVEQVGPEGLLPERRGQLAGALCLTDHKFRSGLKLYGESLHDLSPDRLRRLRALFKRQAQPLHYTISYLMERSLREASAFKWNVVDKRTLKVAVVMVAYAPGEAVRLFQEHWSRTLERMAFTRRLPRLDEVPPTGALADDLSETCGRYGGCYFRSWCAARGIDVFRDGRRWK